MTENRGNPNKTEEAKGQRQGSNTGAENQKNPEAKEETQRERQGNQKHQQTKTQRREPALTIVFTVSRTRYAFFFRSIQLIFEHCPHVILITFVLFIHVLGQTRPKKQRNKKQLRLGWAGPRPSQPNLFWAKVCLTKYAFMSISFILFSFCVDILLN